MKKTISIFLLLLFWGAHVSTAGDNSSGNNTVIVTTPRNPTNIHGPKAPSRQQVDCSYDGVMLYISFRYS